MLCGKAPVVESSLHGMWSCSVCFIILSTPRGLVASFVIGVRRSSYASFPSFNHALQEYRVVYNSGGVAEI
jgi:hypothetical protein